MTVLNELKKVRRKIPVNLFFLELIIVLLFFSVSGAVVLRMFASADVLSEKSSLTERAVMNVQSLSEIYAADGNMKAAADKLFGKDRYTYEPNGSISVCLDEDMIPLILDEIKAQSGRVEIDLSERRTRGACGELCELSASVRLLADGGREIYSQVSSVYIPDTGKGAAR